MARSPSREHGQLPALPCLNEACPLPGTQAELASNIATIRSLKFVAEQRAAASIEAVESGLAAQGYIASRQIATAVYLAAADRKADPGRGPGRRRQDRAGEGDRGLARTEDDPPAVLRGPRRSQGALRVEIRQAAALHPDPEGQARRSARRRADAGSGAGAVARFRRRVLLQGIRRAAAAAAGAGTAEGLRAADRRNRQIRRRVRIAAAGNPQRFPGHDSGARHGRRGRARRP